MTFLWPQGLWLLLLVPAIIAAYYWVLRGKDAVVARHSGLALVAQALGGRSPRRHIPPALFALAMILLLAAAARPTALMVMPTEARTVILAIDISGSMAADDVAPTRLAAAQAAARNFAATLPSSVRIGVVAFSDEAHLIQAPTADREGVLFAIGSLQLENGTAIGRGLVASLQAAFPRERLEIETLESAAAGSTVPRAPAVFRDADASVAVILLTDGQNSHGPHPLEAVPLAAKKGVRVYTVGVGTPFGVMRDERGFSAPVGIDEETLKEVAALTDGEYFLASSAPDLNDVYSRLGAKVVLARIRTEISALLCAFAALAATVSAAMSLAWFGRVL
jgi:Ca-activated chloride channel family protein